ncbi:MAG: DNA gyrase C-terminal beta-propeller domain-containing protein, partial [Candidatus Woesearchaeota archaeon]
YDLTKAKERQHLLEGLLIALDHIDEVIETIKRATDTAHATTALCEQYQLTPAQAKAILEMRLQRLSGLEQQKIRDEHAELVTTIAALEEILASPAKIKDIIKHELTAISATYGDDRRTTFAYDEDDVLAKEDLIKEEEVVVTVSSKGYVKRTSLTEYRTQGRGGKGITAAKTADDDFLVDIYVANTHDVLLVFTDRGKAYWLNVYEIPEGGRAAKGKPIINLVELEQGEQVQAIIPVRAFTDDQFIVFVTTSGVIKKTPLSNFANPRKTGIIATVLDAGDSLVNAVLTYGANELVVATAKGLAARIPEQEIRPMGRISRGVIGIRLNQDDMVIGMIRAEQGSDILSISKKGYGKKTPVSEYRLIHRGGKGVINFKVNEKTGDVISICNVKGNEELLLISRQGISLRTATSNISTIGRNTQGVRLIRLEPGDEVVSSTLIKPESVEDFQEVQQLSSALQEKVK